MFVQPKGPGRAAETAEVTGREREVGAGYTLIVAGVSQITTGWWVGVLSYVYLLRSRLNQRGDAMLS